MLLSYVALMLSVEGVFEVLVCLQVVVVIDVEAMLEEQFLEQLVEEVVVLKRENLALELVKELMFGLVGR